MAVSNYKTLVFIHGWASNPQIWRRQKEYFNSEYNLAMPDISGARTIFKAADIVNKDIPQGNDYVLIGWSLGWMVVLELLKSFALKPKGIIAVNSTPKLADDGYIGKGPGATHLAKMIRDCKRDPRELFESFYKGLISENDSDAISSIRMKNIDYEKLIYGLYILKDCDYRKFIQNIETPTLIITGKFDTVCPPEASVYMSERIKGSRLMIFDSGHMPFLDKAEEFNMAVYSFIKGLDKDAFS